jgi:hypothetical protein
MIRQGLEALDQETPAPRELDTDRTTAAAPREPLDQHVCDEGSGVSSDEVVCAAVDKLTAAGMALMVLCAVVEVAILRVLGRLTPWTHRSEDPGLLWTSAGVGSVFGQQSQGIPGRALHGVHYQFSGACSWRAKMSGGPETETSPHDATRRPSSA